MKKLSVGIVGSGVVAQMRHIPAFLRLKNHVSISAICDLNENLAIQVAKRFRIPSVYTDLESMLSNEQLSIIDVCTPPQTHKKVAISAIESGCHVLVEKPMATTLSDCSEMIDASKRKDVKLSVVHNQRFYPPFLKAQELIQEGRIGKLIGLRTLILTNRNMYMNQEEHWVHKLPAGVIEETGPHAIYMSLPFIKSIIDLDVRAKKTLKHPWVLFDDYRIIIEGKNIDSSIMIAHSNNCTATEMDFICTEGVIRTDLQSMLLSVYRRRDFRPRSLAFSSLHTAKDTILGVTSNAVKTLFGQTFLGHNIMIDKFVKSVIHDRPVPVPPEEGKETIRVMELIVKKLAEKYNLTISYKN